MRIGGLFSLGVLGTGTAEAGGMEFDGDLDPTFGGGVTGDFAVFQGGLSFEQGVSPSSSILEEGRMKKGYESLNCMEVNGVLGKVEVT